MTSMKYMLIVIQIQYNIWMLILVFVLTHIWHMLDCFEIYLEFNKEKMRRNYAPSDNTEMSAC